jgi:SecD/SecF fusion protein
MQGKGFVKLFATLLLLIVAYQTLLLYPTWSVETAAEEHGRASVQNSSLSDKEKDAEMEANKNAFLDSVSSEKIFLNFTYQQLKKQQLALGLDLKGGMSVVLQVDLRDLILALATESGDTDFRKAIADAQEMQKNTQLDFVTLFGQAFEKNSANKKLAAIFVIGNKLQGINLESTNAQVIRAIRTEASATVQNTYKRLKERIDKFGVTQPTVSLDETTDRITVELPGVTNPTRARQYLQTTANLEFWEVFYANGDPTNVGKQVAIGLQELNDILKAKKTAKTTLDSSKIDTNNIVKIDSSKIDTNNIVKIDSSKIDTNNKIAIVDTTDLGPLFSILNISNGFSPVIGAARGRDTAQVNSFLNSAEGKRVLPKNGRFVWEKKAEMGEQGRFYALYCLNTLGKKNAPLQGDRIRQSTVSSDPQTGGFAVDISMDATGAKEWKTMTERAFGNGSNPRVIAIVLDNQTYSVPRVNSVIRDGNTQITGGFDAIEANDLANILSIGKLPTRTQIIEEAIVGPSLGAATASMGLIALAIGFFSVLVFMLAYYSFSGFISILSLMFNLVVIVSCLASFGTVLTLPGIAGIVLTIGMAVDANVIIFERMRECRRLGMSWSESLNKGFTESYSSIFDANITTLLTALILFYFGLGPIKGFATVLIFGVLSSVFTAVFVSRLFFDFFGKNGEKEISLGSQATIDILSAPKTDFMGKRKLAYGISGALIIAGLISMFTTGFDLGVDFKGGRSYVVEFTQPVNADELKAKLTKSFTGYDKIIIKSFNTANQVKITTSYLQDQNADNADDIVQRGVYEGVKTYANSTTSYDEFCKQNGDIKLNASSKVGATIADDIRQSAFLTAILALLAIFAYIFVRFRKWQYSAGAIIALAHDVLITLGIFSLCKSFMPFSLEVNQEFIAAILTVIGYSINDTVIVFDRIRETIKEKAGEGHTLSNLINDAINNTLSRTFMTSFTTLLVVFLLFCLGGDSVKGFSFALLVGIGVGTYSSIFIASPIIVDFTKDINVMLEPERRPSVIIQNEIQDAPEPTEEEFNPKNDTPDKKA